MQEPLLSSNSALIEHINNHHQHNPRSLNLLLAESTVGSSLASFYTSLGLFVISVPGLWSLIKRSVKSKNAQSWWPECFRVDGYSKFFRGGAYYWKRASRKEQIKVGEDGTLSEILVQGDDQQVGQIRKELQLSEKGLVCVKDVFER